MRLFVIGTASVRAGREIGVVGSIGSAIRQWFHHLLIVRVVDGGVVLGTQTTACVRSAYLVLDAIHPNWFAN